MPPTPCATNASIASRFAINPESYSVPSQSSAVLFEDRYHAVVNAANSSLGQSISLAQCLQMRHVVFQANGKPFSDTWFERTHGAARSVEVLANSFTQPLPQN